MSAGRTMEQPEPAQAQAEPGPAQAEPASPPRSDLKTLKRANKVLKQAVREEQQRSAELAAQVQGLQVAEEGREEEVKQLEFHNNRLKKRVDALQQDLEQQASAGGSSWGLGGALTGWGSTLSKADAEKLQEDMAMMQEQLELKIRENETLHIEMFDLRAEHKTAVEALEQQVAELRGKLEAAEQRAQEQTW